MRVPHRLLLEARSLQAPAYPGPHLFPSEPKPVNLSHLIPQGINPWIPEEEDSTSPHTPGKLRHAGFPGLVHRGGNPRHDLAGV